MGKADYLKKLAKQRSDKQSTHASTTVSILNRVIIPKVNVEPEPENVEQPGDKPTFKGFKRIDNGRVVEEKQLDKEEALVEVNQVVPAPPATVYRDKSGRIVDISQAKSELEAKQKERENQWQPIKAEVKPQEFVVGGNRKRIHQHDLDIEDPMAEWEPEVVECQLYQGEHPSNRFGISAGAFWDGVDRGNGFEPAILAKRMEVKVKARESKVDGGHEDYDDFD